MPGSAASEGTATRARARGLGIPLMVMPALVPLMVMPALGPLMLALMLMLVLGLDHNRILS